MVREIKVNGETFSSWVRCRVVGPSVLDEEFSVDCLVTVRGRAGRRIQRVLPVQVVNPSNKPRRGEFITAKLVRPSAPYYVQYDPIEKMRSRS